MDGTVGALAQRIYGKRDFRPPWYRRLHWPLIPILRRLKRMVAP